MDGVVFITVYGQKQKTGNGILKYIVLSTLCIFRCLFVDFGWVDFVHLATTTAVAFLGTATIDSCAGTSSAALGSTERIRHGGNGFTDSFFDSPFGFAGHITNRGSNGGNGVSNGFADFVAETSDGARDGFLVDFTGIDQCVLEFIQGIGFLLCFVVVGCELGPLRHLSGIYRYRDFVSHPSIKTQTHNTNVRFVCLFVSGDQRCDVCGGNGRCRPATAATQPRNQGRGVRDGS